MTNGNREFRSDVFSMLMEYPENALSLYNAVNHTEYDNPDEVEIYKLDKGISLTVRNDASFILDAQLSVYEHQSTICPNMPIRSLVYYTSIAEKLINKNIYSKSKVMLPTPRFAVFYNGDENQPEKQVLKLSSLYKHPMDNPELELTCIVYNINKGKNKELLDNCQFLREYMTFVDYVRDYNRNSEYNNLELAIERAINRCIDENVLKDFLIRNRSEVAKVIQMDYTFDRQLTLEREESREEGRAEGRAEGQAELLYSLVYSNKISSADAAELLSISEVEFISKMNEAGFKNC